jgi:hypothetical protein
MLKEGSLCRALPPGLSREEGRGRDPRKSRKVGSEGISMGIDIWGPEKTKKLKEEARLE